MTLDGGDGGSGGGGVWVCNLFVVSLFYSFCLLVGDSECVKIPLQFGMVCFVELKQPPPPKKKKKKKRKEKKKEKKSL